MCRYKEGITAKKRRPPRRPMIGHTGSRWHSPR
jgi:hypothetical protein